jgi:hypothetical protein
VVWPVARARPGGLNAALRALAAQGSVVYRRAVQPAALRSTSALDPTPSAAV